MAMTWEQVVAVATELPEVAESTWWRSPALKVSGKGFARLRSAAEGGIVLLCEMAEKEAISPPVTRPSTPPRTTTATPTSSSTST